MNHFKLLEKYEVDLKYFGGKSSSLSVQNPDSRKNGENKNCSFIAGLKIRQKEEITKIKS